VVVAGAVTDGPRALAVGRLLAFREPVNPERLVLFDRESQYERVLVTAHPRAPNFRVMILDKLRHSGVNLHDRLDLLAEYTWVYEAVMAKYAPTSQPISALVIGGGGYIMPYYIERTRPGSRICVAEIDPVVTEAAQQAFGLPTNAAIEIHNMDARNLVADLARDPRANRFEFIMGDSINHHYVPFHLTTQEFNAQLAALLDTNGVYMLHFVDSLAAGRFVGSVIRTMRATFPQVYGLSLSADPATIKNLMVIGAWRPLDLADIPERIRARHPQFAGFVLTPAMLDEAAGRPGAVVLTDDYAPVENLLLNVVRGNDEDRFQKYYELSLAAGARGDYTGAVAALEKVLRRNPNHADALYHIARNQMLAGESRAALATADRLLGVEPRSGRNLALRGEILARLGRMDEALAALETAVATAPAETEARNALGILLAALGRPDAALEQWREVLQRAPADATAHYYAAQLLLSRGDLAQAARHEAEARRADPEMRSIKRMFIRLPTTNAADLVRQYF